MNYQIKDFQLFSTENKLVNQQGEQLIRPKTMQLLLFFIQNPHKTFSKQALLDAVWQSAGAQEHVLFQSINEIRALFKPLDVIQTFPRQGYMWLQEVEKIAPSTVNKVNPQSTKLTSVLFPLLAIIILISFTWFTMNHSQTKNTTLIEASTKTQTSDNSIVPLPSRELVVLPVQNLLQDDHQAWIRLGAMDLIIKRLQSQQQLFVLDVEDVLRALSSGDSFDVANIEQQDLVMRSHLGEIVTLHTKLLGSPMEYQLHYSLMGRYQVKQGIVFAETLDILWGKLVEDVMNFYQTSQKQSLVNLTQQMADHSFLQAMELYYRGDYQSAKDYFSVMLKSTPEHLMGQRYLVKTLVALNQYQQAKLLAEKAMGLAKSKNNIKEHSRLLFELGVIASQQKDFQKADLLLNQAKEQAKTSGDDLYTAFAYSQLGGNLENQQQFKKAAAMYETALHYHQSFQCPYGQIHNLDSLGRVALLLNSTHEAEQYFNQALKLASEKGLYYEHIYLLFGQLMRVNSTAEKQQLILKLEQLIGKLKSKEVRIKFENKLTQLITSEK